MSRDGVCLYARACVHVCLPQTPKLQSIDGFKVPLACAVSSSLHAAKNGLSEFSILRRERRYQFVSLEATTGGFQSACPLHPLTRASARAKMYNAPGVWVYL